MKRTAIVTLAGCSQRFSRSVGFECHKSIYHGENDDWTILAHQLGLLKESGIDDIILVGGFRYDDVVSYVQQKFSDFPVRLVFNPHYEDYGSCYSLVLGIQELDNDVDEVVFLEGDLIFDTASFLQIIAAGQDVVTTNKNIIEARTAVAFYISKTGRLNYVYDTKHQALSIPEPFTKIANSGQVWKLVNPAKLKKVIKDYAEAEFRQTNLLPIQDYFSDVDCNQIGLIAFLNWFNCNTVEDYLEMKTLI